MSRILRRLPLALLRIAVLAASLHALGPAAAQAEPSWQVLSLRRAAVQLGPDAGHDRFRLRGELALEAGRSIDPAAETVVLALLDRGGLVYLASLEPGALRTSPSGRRWYFTDRTGERARGLRKLSLATTDGTHFRWEAQGRGLDLAEANELALEVMVSVGDDCACAVEPCHRGRDGRSLACKPASPGAAQAAQVEVAALGRSAPLPAVVSVSALGWDPFAPWAMLAPYAPTTHLGQVRLYTLDLAYYFDRTATTRPTAAQWQQAESSVRTWAREIRDTALAAAYQPTANLTGMPRWLSSRPDDESVHPNGAWLLAWSLSPPASLEEWANLVGRFVAVIAEEGLHLPYQVWDEPNWMFYGTLDDYLDLYETTASAVRAADPLALVGGPGVSGFRTAKDGGWAAPTPPPVGAPIFLPAWIAEMGRRGAPIDFVDWHFPTPDPHDGRIDLMATLVRGWLGDAGYDPAAVRLRIGEWLHENCGQEAADLPSAAEIVSMLSRLADAGFTWQTHTSFTDQSNWSGGCWTHVGLFSGAEQHPHYVVRAKLNVFRLVAWLGDRQLPVALRDPLVEAIATQSDDGYEILLANAASTAGTTRATRRAVAERCATSEISMTGCNALDACWRAWLGGTAVEPRARSERASRPR